MRQLNLASTPKPNSENGSQWRISPRTSIKRVCSRTRRGANTACRTQICDDEPFSRLLTETAMVDRARATIGECRLSDGKTIDSFDFEHANGLRGALYGADQRSQYTSGTYISLGMGVL